MMKGIIGLLVAIFIGVGICSAWATWAKFQDHSPAAPSGYVGILDVLTTANAANCSYPNGCGCWSLRACSAATRGNAVANICYSPGGVDQNCVLFYTDATTGQLIPQVVFSGNTCPGPNCVVNNWYDQGNDLGCGGSNCDLNTNTAAARPAISASVFGSQPGIVCNGSSDLRNAAIGSYSVPFSFIAVGERTGATSSFGDLFGFGNTGNVQIGFTNSTNGSLFYQGNIVSGTANDNVFHIYSINMTGNNATGSYQIDGNATVTGQNFGGNNISTDFHLCTDNNPLTGDVAEMVFMPNNISVPFSAIYTNENAFW